MNKSPRAGNKNIAKNNTEAININIAVVDIAKFNNNNNITTLLVIIIMLDFFTVTPLD